jgi:hypothetical protein
MNMDLFTGCVDVRDVAQSLITLYENPSAQGRHLCMESLELWIDFTNKIANLYPEFPIHRWVIFGTTHFIDPNVVHFADIFSFHVRIKEDKQGWVVRSKDPSKKLLDLGIRFIPFDTTIRETVDCFRSKGLI